MKMGLYLSLTVILLLVAAGCGSGKSDGVTDTTEFNLTTSKISPEVGIVLNLLTGPGRMYRV